MLLIENIDPISEILGETTDVESWLIRAGLKFSDLGKDAASIAIRKQWREYQAAVQRCCATLHQPPSRVQLTGDYANLRIPGGTSTNSAISCRVVPSPYTGQNLTLSASKDAEILESQT